MNQLRKIDPADNVWVVCLPIYKGDTVEIAGESITFHEALGLGHKVAAEVLAKGTGIIKFGLPIGVATEDIALGGHVHLHNLKSNFISTYTLDHEFIKDK